MNEDEMMTLVMAVCRLLGLENKHPSDFERALNQARRDLKHYREAQVLEQKRLQGEDQK
jgi:hypothetical protein